MTTDRLHLKLTRGIPPTRASNYLCLVKRSNPWSSDRYSWEIASFTGDGLEGSGTPRFQLSPGHDYGDTHEVEAWLLLPSPSEDIIKGTSKS